MLQLRDRSDYCDGTFRYPDKDHLLFYVGGNGYRIAEGSYLFNFIINKHKVLRNSQLQEWPEYVPYCFVNTGDLFVGSENPRIRVNGEEFGTDPKFPPMPAPKYRSPKVIEKYMKVENYGIF